MCGCLRILTEGGQSLQCYQTGALFSLLLAAHCCNWPKGMGVPMGSHGGLMLLVFQLLLLHPDVLRRPCCGPSVSPVVRHRHLHRFTFQFRCPGPNVLCDHEMGRQYTPVIKKKELSAGSSCQDQ